MSASPSGEYPDVGEVAIILLSILAIILASALLPTISPFAGLGGGAGGGGGPGGGSGMAQMNGSASGTGTSKTTTGTKTTSGSGNPPGEGSDSSSDMADSGSPSGLDLQQPPSQMGIGSTQGLNAKLPARPLFLVNSSAGYWRQASYGIYTGSGWGASRHARAYNGSVPHDARTIRSQRTRYAIRLLTNASSLPTAWQPTAVHVDAANATPLVSTDGAFFTRRTLPPTTTYTGVSDRPPRTASQLQTAGTRYPNALHDRYTQLPSDVPSRVGRLSARLTAGDATPYEKAITIRNWLRTHKEYSLNASHGPGGHVVDQFLFEMDAGYCQYFASAMVVMLRTQDIPARYVVGFANGIPVGDNEYLVRSNVGHAWVEVYFPDVGWVRFDPTASGKLPSIQSPQPPYNITLNRSAVAGAPVSISVQKNGSGVVGAPVLINGKRVGWTNGQGSTTAQLPYVRTITITARPPDSIGKTTARQTTTTADEARGGSIPRDHTSDRHGAIRRPDLRELATPDSAHPNNSSATYHADTNVSIAIRGTPRVGTSVALTATVRDVPIGNATVTLRGTQVGKTNESGGLTMPLANVTAGNHTVRVARGEVYGTQEIHVTAPTTENTSSPPSREPVPVNLSLRAPFGFPVTFGPATATVTRSGSPVTNASVTMDGQVVGTTDANGTLALQLPFRPSAEVAATGPKQTSDTAVVRGMYRNTAIALGVGVGVLGALIWWLRRRGVTVGRLQAGLARWVRWLQAVSIGAVFRLVDLLFAAVALSRAGIWSLLARLRQLPSLLVSKGVSVVFVLDPRTLVRRVWQWLLALVTGRLHRVRGAYKRQVTEEVTGTQSASSSTVSVRSLWWDFVSLLHPPGMTSRTPGEIASYAIQRGVPERPVWRITRAYQDAEYGREEPGEEELSTLQRALEAVKSAVQGDRD